VSRSTSPANVAGGWDNQQWRLGAELAVRLPRTERAPALLRAEQKWLPVLAERLPLPTPTPVRIGEPSALFEHTADSSAPTRTRTRPPSRGHVVGPSCGPCT
jgi:Phosphotransferase enzyme family